MRRAEYPGLAELEAQVAELSARIAGLRGDLVTARVTSSSLTPAEVWPEPFLFPTSRILRAGDALTVNIESIFRHRDSGATVLVRGARLV